MKKLSLVLLIITFLSVSSKATYYIMVRQSVFGRTKIKLVPKPKNLIRWYYDSNNDTYIQEKNALGMPKKLKNGVIKKIKL